MNKWMNEWMNEWMNVTKPGLVDCGLVDEDELY